MEKQAIIEKFENEVKGMFKRYGAMVSPLFGDYKWFYCSEKQEPIAVMRKHRTRSYRYALEKWAKKRGYVIE